MVLSDFSDVDSWFDEETARVLEKELEIGVEAVEYAKDNGNYQNHTGLLRKSNDFEVDEMCIRDSPCACQVPCDGSWRRENEEHNSSEVTG